MNRFFKFIAAPTLLVLGVSCVANSKKAEETLSEQTVVFTEGTYEGVMPAADCPGIHVQLATDGSNYEMVEKYLERKGVFVTRGKAHKNQQGDSLFLDGTKIAFKVGEGELIGDRFSLALKAEETTIPKIFTQQILKEKKGENTYELFIYSADGVKYADLHYKDRLFHLPESQNNSQMAEYTDGKAVLKMDILSQNQSKTPTYVVIEGKTVYQFIPVSPVNNLFVATDPKTSILSFDVLYFNTENQHFVRLLNADAEYCFTLSQKEASAKTAIYGNDEVEWSINNNGTASLTIKGITYKYNEVPLRK